jgi:hypothetical protein
VSTLSALRFAIFSRSLNIVLFQCVCRYPGQSELCIHDKDEAGLSAGIKSEKCAGDFTKVLMNEKRVPRKKNPISQIF